MPGKIGFRLMVITDRKLTGKQKFQKVIRVACASGIKAVQLREKDLDSKSLLLLAKEMKNITAKNKAALIINDRLDIAMLCGAAGIQVPVNGLTINAIKTTQNKLLAGKSIHSVNDAVKAEKDGYDYLLFGPVFRTVKKIKYGKPQGLKNLKEICGKVKTPVFAVGGINPVRAKKCIDAGAYGVAVISALMKSKNIKKTVSEFKSSLGEL